jgi:hypothetical protein
MQLETLEDVLKKALLLADGTVDGFAEEVRVADNNAAARHRVCGMIRRTGPSSAGQPR